ncbi:MAG: outer membrane protein transport protein, partial [Gammaproteobacteria bacterium]
LALGAGYKQNDTLSFDVSYVYIKVDDAAINKTAGAPGSENFLRGSLVGTYEANTQILGAQLNWKF